MTVCSIGVLLIFFSSFFQIENKYNFEMWANSCNNQLSDLRLSPLWILYKVYNNSVFFFYFTSSRSFHANQSNDFCWEQTKVLLQYSGVSNWCNVCEMLIKKIKQVNLCFSLICLIACMHTSRFHAAYFIAWHFFLSSLLFTIICLLFYLPISIHTFKGLALVFNASK